MTTHQTFSTIPAQGQQPAVPPPAAQSQTLAQPASDGPLLSLRAAVVLTIAALVGIGVGVLTGAAGSGTAAAVLAGCTACGVSALGLNKVIGS
ncbi:hypothetical protein ACFY8C_38435 [Streptomyces flavochromogenes]|uniref:SpdD protein n=1 Tax=Streptomyces flavochromogenes TaxID=68199 RepID=A0ABW6Y306_9ACTN